MENWQDCKTITQVVGLVYICIWLQEQTLAKSGAPGMSPVHDLIDAWNTMGFSLCWNVLGFVWKCWVNIPNEIAIFHRDNDQQNHWV